MPGKRSISEEEQPFTFVNTDATAGATKAVERFDLSTGVVEFHSFHGVTPGSYILQGSIDGDNWTAIQAAIIADDLVALTHYWRFLRVFTTTAGTTPPTVVLGAHELLY